MSAQDTSQNSIIATWGNFVTYAYAMYTEGGVTPPPPAELTKDWDLIGYINAVEGATAVNYGFLARQKNADGFVIALRGTEGWYEWAKDAEFPQVPFTLPGSGQVEEGFLAVFQTMWFQAVGSIVRQPLRDGILAAIGSLPAPVVVAAHSLGTALGTMLTAILVSGPGGLKAADVSCYLLAPPKPGDAAFAALYGSLGLSDRTWRVAYQPDVVPQCPPSVIWTYQDVPANSIVLKFHPEIVLSLGCNHSLATYLWLLDAGRFPLASGCDWYSLVKAGAVAPPTVPVPTVPV